MIIFYHNNNKIAEIISTETGMFPNETNWNIVAGLLDFSEKFKDEIFVWCDESERNNLNVTEIEKLFHHKKLMFSYNAVANYFERSLGFIEDSPYIKVNLQ